MHRLAIAALLVAACKGSGDTAERPGAPSRPFPEVELPELAGPGTGRVEDTSPLVAATLASLTLDGVQVIALRDGAVDPADKEGGASGIKIGRLTRALASVDAPRSASLYLALDRRLTYRFLHEVLYSAKQKEAGWSRFTLLVRAGGKLAAIPIALPERNAVTSLVRGPGADVVDARSPDGSSPVSPASPLDEVPLGLYVSVTRTDLVLWSLSGEEGTLREPKLRIGHVQPDAIAKLQRSLGEIVGRRWAGRKRPETSPHITVIADRAVTLEAVAEILAAVRAGPDGKELFRDILLGTDFE